MNWMYIFKNVFRNRRRTMLTAGSIAVSMGLIAVLQTILLEITKPAGVDESIPRIVVRHRTSLSMALPRPYEKKLAKLDGVLAVTPMNWFGGVWKDDRFENFFPRFGVDPETFFDVYVDYHPVDPAMLDAFKADRRGTLVGKTLVERYGWKIGDTLQIRGDIYPIDLELKIVGIFDGPQSDWSIFQMKYLDEALGETTRAGTFFLLAEDAKRVDTLLPEIEGMFRNSEAEVKAETEKAFQLSFVEMLGNVKLFINSLVGVVIFAVCMIAASTMALAIRERTREIATLKAIGFTAPQVLALVVGEGMLVSALGGFGGLVASWILLPSPKWFASAAAGAFVMAILGLSTLALAMLLPETRGLGRLSGIGARIRAVAMAAGPTTAMYAGIFVALLVMHTMPPMDWFKFSGGMINRLAVRNETLAFGAVVTVFLGLASSLWPAWQASRLSVLDGLRSVE